MELLACPECGHSVAGTLKGKIRKHNRSSMKFDTCPASGLTADEYNGRALDQTAEQIARLEYLRGEIRAERISYGEMAELAELAEHIESGDTELLEWAGVPEHDRIKKMRGALEPHEHAWQLTEAGYIRSWSTEIDDDGKITAHYGGAEDWSEEGDGVVYLECLQCGAVNYDFDATEIDYQ